MTDNVVAAYKHRARGLKGIEPNRDEGWAIVYYYTLIVMKVNFLKANNSQKSHTGKKQDYMETRTKNFKCTHSAQFFKRL